MSPESSVYCSIGGVMLGCWIGETFLHLHANYLTIAMSFFTISILALIVKK